MRILHLLSQVELTGAEVYAVTLAEWQQRQGHTVYLASDELHQKTVINYLKLNVHRTNSWNRWQSKKILLDFIVKNKIDVVHAHSRAAVRIAYSCTRKTSCALATTLHGRPHRSWSKNLFDIYGDKVISICENLTLDLQLNLKMKAHKIRTIPNPIDTKIVSISKLSRENSHQPTNDAHFKIAIVGRTSGPKGVRTSELLIDIFPQLLETYPNLSVEIIGGPLEKLPTEGQEQFHRLKSLYKERVKNTPHIPNLEYKLNKYDLILGAGRIALASMISEIPLFALGEYSAIGLINEKNYQYAKASNFGDIHHNELHTTMNRKNVSSDLENIITNKTTLNKNELENLSTIAAKDFSLDEIAPAIIDTYKSARFKKLFPQWIPILMYHKVTDQAIETKHRIFVTKATFEKHLQFFKKKNFQTLSFSDLKDFRDLKKDPSLFPKNPLLITFDDGYVNNLENAVPLLEKYNFKACFFLLADKTVKTNQWDKDDGTPQLPLLDSLQRLEIKKNNQEIGSHGFNHKKLSEMNIAETDKELSESKITLEKEFNNEIVVYAYTYGIKNDFAEISAKNAGYTYAVNTATGGLHIEDNPYSIFRVSIFPEDGTFALRKKTHPLYRKYYFFKRRQ